MSIRESIRGQAKKAAQLLEETTGGEPPEWYYAEMLPLECRWMYGRVPDRVNAEERWIELDDLRLYWQGNCFDRGFYIKRVCDSCGEVITIPAGDSLAKLGVALQEPISTYHFCHRRPESMAWLMGQIQRVVEEYLGEG